MEVKLYRVDDADNKLNKNLLNETIVNGNFRNSVDIMNPVISLTGFDFKSFNYCFIPKLDRYYFIEKVTIQRKNLLIVDLKVDVLQSYKDKIKTGRGTAIESEEGNRYIDGFIENTDVRPSVDKYEFLDKFNHKGKFVMVVSVTEHKGVYQKR